MLWIAVAIGVALISVLTLPFFVGPGGLLQAGSSINSPERLRALKAAILKRYLEDEAAHKNGALGNLAWEKRKVFLTHRYVDASRRLDFLENAGAPATKGGAS